jgi:CTP synthase (UTP-ammonia lyase)
MHGRPTSPSSAPAAGSSTWSWRWLATCSGTGTRATPSSTLVEGSVVAAAYGREQTTERYYCDFGLNPAYVDDLAGAGLVVTGTGPEGEPRVVEAPGHRFFVGTLFVPQSLSSPASPAPLVTALLAATNR